MTKCPELLMGKNSVSPWTMPRIRACKESMNTLAGVERLPAYLLNASGKVLDRFGKLEGLCSLTLLSPNPEQPICNANAKMQNRTIHY